MSELVGTIVKFGEYNNGILVKTLRGVVWESGTLSISVKCENGKEYSLLGGQYEVIPNTTKCPTCTRLKARIQVLEGRGTLNDL